jgi:ParB-like chromosome segregation protein Spo0J
MKVEQIDLKKLKGAEYNPRIITVDELTGLMKSLTTFGQTENLIVNKDMTLISGHQRMEAMKKLGWDSAWCYVVDLDKKLEKKLNVIMNSQAISGKWDDNKLAEILFELKDDEDYEALRLNELEPLDLSLDAIVEDEPPAVEEIAISVPGEIYQVFLGSGSTLMACEQTKRKCYGMELDPRYVDVIRKRYANSIGKGEEWQTATPKVS